jgi:RNA polymerase sigma-70 factor (ECF subfamily)
MFNMDRADTDRDDAWAVRRTLNGDHEAFAVLVRRYQGPVFRLMLRFTRDEEEAAELAQEAFVKAFERLGSFDGKRRFFTWLYTLSLNMARDHARKSARTPAGNRETERIEDSRHDPLASLEAAGALQALRELPPKYAEALALRYIEDMSLNAVAETLGLSMSAAKMRVHRALRLMRRHYGEDE